MVSKLLKLGSYCLELVRSHQVSMVVISIGLVVGVFCGVQSAKADYGTYLKESYLSWDDNTNIIHATWSPGDNDGGDDQCEGEGIWSCGCRCVDEGQEQYLKPYIKLYNTSGGLWDEYHSGDFSPAKWPIHWYTSPEGWDPNLLPYNDFYLDLTKLPNRAGGTFELPDGNGYSVEFCIILDNKTTEGEDHFPCGHKITFNKTTSCIPDCSAAPNYYTCQTFTDANNCGVNNCAGTKPANCECAASTPINQTCWDGCKTCNGTLNRPPTGTLGTAPCDNDPNGNGAWATIRGTAVDPDQMPTRARCRQNSGALTEVATDASGNFSYTYPSLFGTNTIYCWAVDSTNSAVTTYLGSRSYTKINEATYSGANRCDVYYQLYVNGTQMNWGAANENKYGYLDGNCSQINYNVSPINYSYYTGSCTSSLINWKARVKGVMADGGKVNLRVVGHNDKYTAVFTGPCNSPSLSRLVGQEEFLQTKDYQCSIPQGIGLDPDSLDFDYTDVSFNGLPENVDATIRCTLNDEIVDITTNTVDVRKGELEACFNVVLVGQSAPYNIYNVSDNYLVSRCEGSVNFHIDDYLYDGENWGPMNGALSLYYNPATDNTSERFEYSGDVIVNPPPGFDQFIFPSF